MDDHIITNRKVASLDPTWAPWRGASVLFDNPGLPPGTQLEEATAAGAPEQRLYDDLAVLVDALRPATLRAEYGFCPLPRSTYHVTICDGPNEVELATAGGPAVGRISPLLAGLPGSLPAVADALAFAGVAALVRTVAANPVAMRSEQLVIWGSVLAARMVPADDAAREALAVVGRSRQPVADALGDSLGVAIRPWRPHVSLGYFASLELAERALEQLPVWNTWLDAAEPATITYRSAALYGFTDMVSFFRAGP